ncbi:hypothetical protein PsorP6_003521 [Peronosclerospora sorghi]|uniref:Uncharacterized protein n=1 Tax=Peronosclerospora sorghi TaxID=230839 RepID=A0ACC0VNB8_9STRA|nr:hypothetical protein PsorP6_003521 [Peronosclerospora sorghi]
MALPHLKLTYFDGKGRAELARMIFNYGGITFTDHRIPREDLAALKSTLPFGQVPVLEVDGIVFAQSMAIVRYAAKLAGLYPTEALHALKADMFAYSVIELHDSLVEFVFKTSNEAEKAQKKKVFLEETVPKGFAALEKMVAGKFITGDKILFVDLQFLDFVENRMPLASHDFNVNNFPKLSSLLANVKENPKVATYLSKQ